MKISGFTIARNIVKYNYPVVESIKSILPICNEFIVNVGDSEDNTLDIIKSIDSNKIRIVENEWDMSMGSNVLSYQTNLALEECSGDWAFYVQGDEVIHEYDLLVLKKIMTHEFKYDNIDAIRFRWLHFYGSHFRYRIDKGWYQKQDRIIRNNGEIESIGDAYGFARKDGGDLKRRKTNCFVYHYGWVQPQDVMSKRRNNADKIGFVLLSEKQTDKYSYGDLDRFPVYFGTHPKVMEEKIKTHFLSQQDYDSIQKKYWWNPLNILKVRYKTGKRIKEKID
ncbi:MAG: glycosyltransferase family 2 protein [Candidatus Zapsychrus exili]|nr:glycosyltransferase family 2 protein [Candidatus Zapsychrus exili]